MNSWHIFWTSDLQNLLLQNDFKMFVDDCWVLAETGKQLWWHCAWMFQNDGSSFIQSESSRPNIGGTTSDIGRLHIGGSDIGNTHSNDNVNSFTSAQLPLNNYRSAQFSGFQHVNGKCNLLFSPLRITTPKLLWIGENCVIEIFGSFGLSTKE